MGPQGGLGLVPLAGSQREVLEQREALCGMIPEPLATCGYRALEMGLWHLRNSNFHVNLLIYI